MQPTTRTAVCGFLLTFSALPASAASFYRCEDASGHVTFAQQGCPDDQTQQRQSAYNQRPGKGKAVPLAKPRRAKTKDETMPERAELVIVGTKEPTCDGVLDARARREAIIRKQIRAGMSQEDVESTLGRPTTVTRSNGQVRYRYADMPGRTQTITFDELGCVKGKGKR